MSQPDSPQTILLQDYLPPPFLVERVELAFDLDPDVTLVAAELHLRRNPAAAPESDLWLAGEGLELLSIAVDGHPLKPDEYRADERGLTVLGVPAAFSLSTQVRIHPATNTALEGLYESGPILCTQCEAEGFRRITYYPDRPDVMARFRVTLTGDRERFPVLLSNGNRVETRDLPQGRHRTVWEDPFPKPCYLFALVAGRLERVEGVFTTASGREVALHLYCEPENLDKTAHALASLKKAMRWDEGRFGREYDLDLFQIVAVNDFNMGAMENKGLNIFNAKAVLASPATATDQDFQWVEAVVAHEYFHNWTGNRITCRDWFQLSLKEGLTVFRDQEFSADVGSRGVKRIEDVRRLRTYQFPEDSGPMAHPVRPASYIEINNFYTVTVYEKGAEVVRMQHTLLGEVLFRAGMDLYFARHDGQAVTTDDFVRCMEEASGRDLTQFRRWYEQAGTPMVRVQGRHDPATATYTLTLEQSCPPSPGQPDKQPFHIPLAVGLLGADGGELPLRLAGEGAAPTTRLLELTEASHTVHFEGVPERPVPSLLRGFSAPVRVLFDYDDADLLFLLAQDTDGFNRWDAAQALWVRVLLRRIRDPQAPLPEGLLDAVARVLAEHGGDGALRAELLTLPAESYLGDQMEVVDVDGIHAAREGLKAELAAALRSQWLEVFERHRESGPYDLAPTSIAGRRMRNLALEYLIQTGDAEAAALCLGQYRAGHNMTDVQAALTLIAGSDLPERVETLADFYHRWHHDPLVLDKWFSVQATSRRADALAEVERLLGHPDYHARNPNRVRALVGAFCSNQVRFHAADGRGYAFLADRVAELDPVNPQVASRLVRSLMRWRRFDEGRQAGMRGALGRILALPGLSRDSYEVVSRSLAE